MNNMEIQWIVEENGSEWCNCPNHTDTELKCVKIELKKDEHQKVFAYVTLHGSFWIGPDGAARKFLDMAEAKKEAEEFLASLNFAPAAIAKPKPSVPPISHQGMSLHIRTTETPKVAASAYNIFGVMQQGSPIGPWVLVNSPRFGPVTPDQALNLSVWLRKVAEDCGKVTLTWQELWQLVNTGGEQQDENYLVKQNQLLRDEVAELRDHLRSVRTMAQPLREENSIKTMNRQNEVFKEIGALITEVVGD